MINYSLDIYKQITAKLGSTDFNLVYIDTFYIKRKTHFQKNDPKYESLVNGMLFVLFLASK